MKRIFLTLALVFGLVATAAAQVNVGGRLAVTMSTFKGDQTDDFSLGLGFNAGVAAKYSFNQMFAAVPELGVDFRRVTNSEADDFTFSAWVLQIPLMFRANLTPQFYAEAGPSIAFILSSEADYDAPEIDGTVIFKVPAADRRLEPGEFVPVLIEDAFDYDLVGTVVREKG